jgi:acetyl esterase/lipase
MYVQIDAVDRVQPIEMEVHIADEVCGLPVVEYRHVSISEQDELPTILGFSGGGGSGAMLAMLAEKCAADRIRLIGFDMPGHTPEDLLGAATPSRALVSRSNSVVRRVISASVVTRWLPRSSRLQVLSHSAGIVDVARLIPQHGSHITRFVICGAGIPGMTAMSIAFRGAARDGSVQPLRMTSIVNTRQIPSGRLGISYGPETNRVLTNAGLAKYACPEHISVPLTLLRSRVVERQDWRGRDVALIGSAGDAISPPHRTRDAEERLRARGASVRLEILPGELPHAFLTFEAAAQRVAEIVAGWT